MMLRVVAGAVEVSQCGRSTGEESSYCEATRSSVRPLYLAFCIAALVTWAMDEQSHIAQRVGQSTG